MIILSLMITWPCYLLDDLSANVVLILKMLFVEHFCLLVGETGDDIVYVEDNVHPQLLLFFKQLY